MEGEKVYLIIDDSGLEFEISKKCYEEIINDTERQALPDQILFTDIHGDRHVLQKDSILVTVGTTRNFE